MSEDKTTRSENAERLAVLVAPLGQASGDARWQAAQMMRAQAAEIERLRAALALCMTGGNHLATHIDPNGPTWRAECDAGLTYYGAGPAYDAWCCWRAIMQARETADG